MCVYFQNNNNNSFQNNSNKQLIGVKKYNYEGIEIKNLIKNNQTKSHKPFDSKKKTKKRVQFDLSKNETLKFDKNKPIHNDDENKFSSKEQNNTDVPYKENIALNIFTGETFDIDNSETAYKFRTNNCPIEEINDKFINNQSNNQLNTINMCFNLEEKKSTLLKPNIYMGNNDKKRWIMKKYGFSNLKNLSRNGTNIIYNILNELPINIIRLNK